MALQGSGEIDLGDLQTEFGGTNPASLSEYYRGSVSSSGISEPAPHNTGIPTSGTISLSQFYSTAKQISLTVSNTQDDYNVKTAAGNPSGAVSVSVTITSSGICRGSSYSNYGLTISGFASGSFIFINNAGYIVGKGGFGGNKTFDFNTAYSACEYSDNKGTSYYACIENIQTNFSGDIRGGPAMFIQSGVNVYVNNTGTIGGGGGGGGFGGAWTGSGRSDCPACLEGISIGSGLGAGGGGAGYGSGVTSFSGCCCTSYAAAPEGAGTCTSENGTLTAGGYGCAGSSETGARGTGSVTAGAGGALGTAGQDGIQYGACGNLRRCVSGCPADYPTFNAGSGGAAGAATSGYSNVTTWFAGGNGTGNFKGSNG